ncbi:LppA family lipoprotein [Amycolatopsis sp. NPDC059657]|uniref:LppA family lipoprotein n=1 Tax=Amycolatopsis sp. NPDC059657 TaxID=3346899 RepID=UPI00366E42E9
MKQKHTFTLAALGCILLTATACGGAPKESPMDRNQHKQQQFAELVQRPDIDQATARYSEISTKIRDALSAAFPALKWQQTTQLAGAACGSDYPGLDADGEVRGLPNWMAEGNLPDAQWEQAVSIVRDAARGYGFDGGQVVVNRPNDHEIDFQDQYKAELNFGTAANTTLLIRTGCHLTTQAKQRGPR